jgi:HEAT repeat protein
LNSDWIKSVLDAVVAWIESRSEQFFNYIEKLPRLEVALQILILTVVFIFVLTLIIAAGVVLLRIKNNWNARRFRRLEESWEGRIMDLLAGETPDPNSPLVVKKRDSEFFVQYLFRFAARLRGYELEQIKALARPHLVQVEKRLNKGYPELRARNVNILATLGFPEYIQPIIQSLEDGAPIVKMAAARILADARYPEHINLILPHLSSFDQWSMNFLASMLSEMGAEVAPRLREELINKNGSIRVRIASAEALRRIGDLAAADAAVEVLRSEPDPELSAACLKILRDLGTPRHRHMLEDLVDSENEIVRLHALAALGSIGSSSDADLLEDALNDSSSWVVLQAARAMKKVMSEEQLLKLAASDEAGAMVAQQILAEGDPS